MCVCVEDQECIVARIAPHRLWESQLRAPANQEPPLLPRLPPQSETRPPPPPRLQLPRSLCWIRVLGGSRVAPRFPSSCCLRAERERERGKARYTHARLSRLSETHSRTPGRPSQAADPRYSRPPPSSLPPPNPPPPPLLPNCQRLPRLPVRAAAVCVVRAYRCWRQAVGIQVAGKCLCMLGYLLRGRMSRCLVFVWGERLFREICSEWTRVARRVK